MKIIRLLLEWKNGTTTWPAGSLLEMKAEDADALIADNTAELVDTEAEKKAAEEAAKAMSEDERKTAELIGATVEKVVKSLPVSRPPSVAKVHDQREDDPAGGFKSFGEQVLAVRDAGTPGKRPDERLMIVNQKASGLNVALDSEGGFLVAEAFAADLMQKTFQNGQVVAKCTRVPMATEAIKIPYVNETSRVDGSRQGGVRVYRKAEAVQATASKPAFGMLRLELHKLVGFCYETEEIMKWSAITLDSLLTQMFAREFAFKIDDEIIRGDGAGKPLGVLNSPALVTVAKEAGQDADTVLFENIQKMWVRIPAANRSNAVWFINQEVETQLDAMSIGIGAAGVPAYLPPGGISETPYSRLKGRPVIPIETCSALGDVGDIILADMSQYLYGEDSSGVEGATSIHLRFDYGETALRWTLWNDGQPWWNAALTPYNGGNTVSPFVTLAERA